MTSSRCPPISRPSGGAMWEGLLRDFTIDSSVSVEEIEVSGDWAFERGAYRMKLTPIGGGAPIEDEGKYLDIVRRQGDGTWKYARVSFSSNGAGT